jgi:uncharacterized membrane protein
MNQKRFNVRSIVEAGMIAALYAVTTLVFAPISSGPIQVRISEALTVLPMFTPAAIPGLFVGCIVANIFTSGIGIYDVLFGSLATLVAAYLSYKMPNRYLVPLPPVIVNAVVVGLVLHFGMQAPLLYTMLTVGIGELIACYILGLPLIYLLEKYSRKLFIRK